MKTVLIRATAGGNVYFVTLLLLLGGTRPEILVSLICMEVQLSSDIFPSSRVIGGQVAIDLFFLMLKFTRAWL